MKITKTTREVIDLYLKIAEFMKKDVKMPRQLVWDLEDNFEKLTKIVERYDNHRKEALTPLSEKGAFEDLENGKMRVKPDFADEFIEVNAELEEYLDTTNEIDIRTAPRENVPDELSNKDWQAIKFMCV